MSEEKGFHNVSINWYPGHMAKTKKQVMQDLAYIDIVIELLDARIPKSSKNPQVEDMIRGKKKIVVLNKSDLADAKENQKWINYLKKQGNSTVLVNANSGEGIQELMREINRLAKEDLVKMEEKGRVGKSIRLMILGIPNVGKSSLMNRMAKKSSAGVGNKPGFTKQKQWIRINKGMELLDTPGILWPKLGSDEVALHLAFTGTIKEEVLEKTELAFYLVGWLCKYEIQKLQERYHISKEELEQVQENANENEQIQSILYKIAQKRGALLSGGRIDEEKVSSIVLEEFRNGKIGRITLEKVE